MMFPRRARGISLDDVRRGPRLAGLGLLQKADTAGIGLWGFVGIAAAAFVVLLALLWGVRRSLAPPADLKRTAPEKPYRSRVEYYEETKSNDVVVLDFPPEKESV